MQAVGSEMLRLLGLTNGFMCSHQNVNHFPFREKYFQLDSLLLTWNPENLRKTAIPIPGILAALRHGPMNQQEFETNKYGVWKGVPVITYLGKIGTFT